MWRRHGWWPWRSRSARGCQRHSSLITTRNDRPGRDNVELEPISILVPVDPFVEPKPGELRYEAQIERELDGSNPHSYVRLYRCGVFVGYDIRRTSRLETHPQEREYNPSVRPPLDSETTWQWI